MRIWVVLVAVFGFPPVRMQIICHPVTMEIGGAMSGMDELFFIGARREVEGKTGVGRIPQ